MKADQFLFEERILLRQNDDHLEGENHDSDYRILCGPGLTSP
jgi:hypothetical protein